MGLKIYSLYPAAELFNYAEVEDDVIDLRSCFLSVSLNAWYIQIRTFKIPNFMSELYNAPYNFECEYYFLNW